MQKQYLYLLAMAAVKPDRRFKSSTTEANGRIIFLSEGGAEYGPDIETQVGITPITVIAPSAVEAEKMGLDIAREKFPPADGWLSHGVKLRFMAKQSFKKVLPMISWGEPPDAGDEDDDDNLIEPESLM
jgi:hypothetical protein